MREAGRAVGGQARPNVVVNPVPHRTGVRENRPTAMGGGVQGLLVVRTCVRCWFHSCRGDGISQDPTSPCRRAVRVRRIRFRGRCARCGRPSRGRRLRPWPGATGRPAHARDTVGTLRGRPDRGGRRGGRSSPRVVTGAREGCRAGPAGPGRCAGPAGRAGRPARPDRLAAGGAADRAPGRTVPPGCDEADRRRS